MASVTTVSRMIIDGIIDIYSLIIVGAAVTSWINVPRDNPAVKLLHSATDPVLKPVRKALPETSGIDFSPIVVLVALRILGAVF